MEELLDELDAVLAAGHHRAAMLLAFVIPDHAAALASLDGKTDGKKYAAWFEANMQGGYLDLPPSRSEGPYLSGDDCWRYRCALLHESAGENLKATRRRISFTVGPAGGHMIVIGEEAVVLQLDVFVQDMSRSARDWFRVASKQDFAVHRNLRTRMQLRPGVVHGVHYGESVFL